ncbi:plasmid stabilization protein [Corynebacterium parakroppenstedtii]|uniref:plasmid stabilization protein n=1 Tax=Corynebacterium parakroppenstedtii TaxID=2828363 RepID=UPI001C8E9C8C|nr:plasmid stabilization protein [Corynebacterium parakroppenstedtii]MBY0789019.1 plasmid stabilization protein [Corynebacterium parakroppenstedtii]
MPQQAWNKKHERQYEHIKDSLKDKGRSESTAEEIAARTVNKTRAQQGESEKASPTSTNDKSPSERGGQRSHQGPQGRTKAQLYEDAKRLNIEGRSDMNKNELKHAVTQAERQKNAKKD